MESNELFRLESNYFRVASLILELGTQVIRDAILTHLPLGETLQSLLERPAIYHKLEDLHKRGVIVEKQWEILYPTSCADGNVNMEDIDITLWIVLMRNLILNPLKAIRFRNSGLLRDSWIDDVFVIKEIRNDLFHLPKPEMDDDTFRHFWRRATDAISNLDPRITSFESFKDSTYDAQKLKAVQKLINEQTLTEQNAQLKAELSSHRRSSKRLLFALIVAILAFTVVITLVVYFIIDKKPCQKYRHTTSDNLLVMVERKGWQARTPKPGMIKRTGPARQVIYTHTAETSSCYDSNECCEKINDIQYLYMYKIPEPCEDIGFHYFIDQRGLIYEGKNIKYVPDIAYRHNNESIGIAMLGNWVYQRDIPWQMIASFVYLVKWLVNEGYLIPDYDLYALCEFFATLSPGQYLYDVISCNTECPIGDGDDLFKHVKHTNYSFCPMMRNNKTEHVMRSNNN